MNAKPQHYVQANFALAGWITLMHIDDAEVETKWCKDIIIDALAIPWIASLVKGDSDYGDMLSVRLVKESLTVLHTQPIINNETPADGK